MTFFTIELGINIPQIIQKVLSVINPLRLNAELHEDGDLSGPIILCMLFGFFQLLVMILIIHLLKVIFVNCGLCRLEKSTLELSWDGLHWLLSFSTLSSTF